MRFTDKPKSGANQSLIDSIQVLWAEVSPKIIFFIFFNHNIFSSKEDQAQPF